jgi:hypothetical protein
MLGKAGALSVSFLVLAPLLTAAPAAAAELPPIVAGPDNSVPACVTPGRLMAYLKLRNPKLDARYGDIATEYMRQGEVLGLRWDFAFYQMIVETGSLSFWRGNRHGDVKPSQNNFAGLGATGRGVRGESFPDIKTGVQAHLEHLLLYAGHPVDEPVAERTRNVREWGVLTPWQRTFTRPINYSDLAAKWAPGTKAYSRMLETVADRFNAEVCNEADPQPELLQEARASLAKTPASTKTAATEPQRPSGADLARRALDQAKAEGNDRRYALGAATPPAAAPPPAPFKVLNPPRPETTEPSAAAVATAQQPVSHASAALMKSPAAKTGPAEKAAAAKAPVRTASAATAATGSKSLTDAATAPASGQKCRVWTASYGGQKAIIIRSVADQVVNFTVLDVNEGSEGREAQAFISAYAKNGKIAGEYPTQAQALDKAFELCPEG